MADPASSASAADRTAMLSVGGRGQARRGFLVVELAKGGDRAAFDEILEDRLGAAFRTSLAILGNEADARDACQEAFLSAWRRLPGLREPERFDAWFGRILVNACRSALRARGRRRVRELYITDGDAPSTVARLAPPDERVADIDVLQRAFERLTGSERAVLALHHLEHRSLAEIAVALGIPEGTVKSRLHAARRSFGRALEVAAR